MNTISPLFADKYALNMAYSAWHLDMHNTHVVFESFFRRMPFKGDYAVFVGLERIIEYLSSYQFTEEDIAWITDQPEAYDKKFLNELRNLRFTGDLYSMQEGELVFPNQPMIRVEGRFIEAILIEAAILNIIGIQTLIGTKASRIRRAAGPNKTLVEMGLRRAQGLDAALWGSRAAFIGGFDSTSNMMAGKEFGIPAVGTMAHAWIQMFDNELDAFNSFAGVFPDNTLPLVDTYDTIASGLPNAIKVGLGLQNKGHIMQGIRLDSGDLTKLSQVAREMLDKHGLQSTKIVASNDLDEYEIEKLEASDAKIDTYGVGTKLICSYDQASLGCVYKLVHNGNKPVMKFSEDPGKRTFPSAKTVLRYYIENGTMAGDIISLTDESIVAEKEEILAPFISKGNLLTELKSVKEIKDFHSSRINSFPDLGDKGYFVSPSRNLALLQTILSTKDILPNTGTRERVQ